MMPFCRWQRILYFAIAGLAGTFFWNGVSLDHALRSFTIPGEYIPDVTCKNCGDFRFDYVINNSLLCSSRDVYLLIIVTSSISATHKRQAIRETWGGVTSHNGQGVLTLFLVGSRDEKNNPVKARKMIAREQSKHGDMIQVQLLDSYKNLTYKTGAALHWTVNFCPAAKYILKSDDDSLNIPQAFVEHLSTGSKVEGPDFVAGRCSSGSTPVRNPKHKWYDPVNSYPGPYYPPYIQGCAYIMPRSTVSKLLTLANNVTWNSMEDVFWTGMVRVVAGVARTCYTHTYYKLTPKNIGRCDMAGLMNIHHVDKARMRSYWPFYTDPPDRWECHRTAIFVFCTGLGSVAMAMACVALHRKRKYIATSAYSPKNLNNTRYHGSSGKSTSLVFEI